jgi:hypothetical protein
LPLATLRAISAGPKADGTSADINIASPELVIEHIIIFGFFK